MTIELCIIKENVYKEVSKAAEYTGAKMPDEDAYNRLFVSDEDKELLDQLWNESATDVVKALIRVVKSVDQANGNCNITLDVGKAFEDGLKESMNTSLFCYFVQSILAKWFDFTNKQNSSDCAIKAAAFLDDIREKVFFKKKPTKPIYTEVKPK